MNQLNNNKLIDLLNELLSPVLSVVIFIRDIIGYILNLFSLCWRSACSSMNKDILIPSFITLSLIFFLFNILHLIDFSSDNSDIEKGAYNIITIISIFLIGWGFTIIASIKKAKELNKNSNWRKHLKIGFKTVNFFVTYSILIVFLLSIIMVVSYLGLIPSAGQTLLSLLGSPLFFLAIIVILSCVSLLLGSVLFGGYYCSDGYDESLGFVDRTKRLFCMIGRKFLDCFAVSIPAFIISALFAIIPFVLMLIALGDIIQKPTAGIFNEGQGFPGMVMTEGSKNEKEIEFGDSLKDRSISFLGSLDYHYRYPTNDVINYRQEGFDEIVKEYSQNQKEYDEAVLYANTIKSLGFITPGRQLDSLDAFEESNPDSSQFGGVSTDKLRVSIEDELYQWSIDQWILAVEADGPEKHNELSKLGEEATDQYYTELLNGILRKHYASKWGNDRGFGDNWNFDSNDKLILERLDDWIGEKYILKNDSVYYYSSEYNFNTDSFGEWKNDYLSGKDGKVKYVGYSDSSFFIFLTQIFLAISDALILAFPFMFFYASMGSIFYRLYNSSFKINVFQKIIAIVLILIVTVEAINYIEKTKEKIVFGIIGSIISEDSE